MNMAADLDQSESADDKKRSSRFRPLLNILLGTVFLLCTVIAVRYLWTVIHATTLSELTTAISAISLSRFIIAVLLVGLCYFVITGYDLLGLRFAGSRLPFGKIAPIAFMGDAINANTPFSSIAGSVIKLRLYLKSGESPKTVVKAIAAYTFAYWAGFCTLLAFSGFTMLLSSGFDPARHPAPQQYLFTGIAVLTTAVYLLICGSGKRFLPAALQNFVPRGAIGFKLLGIGIADWFLSTLTFFVLTPGMGTIADLPRFLNTYLIAHALGIVSQLPGGVGIFESTCLMMNPSIAPAALLGSLLVFRVLFFIMPLCVALVMLAVTEAGRIVSPARAVRSGTPDRPAHRIPVVSVVVPAYNEQVALPGCLAALRRQNYPGTIDIIVVDNASTDATAAIAADFGCRVVREPVKGYNRAVKTGFEAATGEIIACTDADTIVRHDWVSRIVNHFSEPETVACGGIFRFHDGPPWLRLIGSVFGRLNYHIAGANMAVRSSAYHCVGGFSLSVNLGADVDLGIRLKKAGRVIIDRGLVVFTSSRRFATAFWKTIFLYYINDISLLLFKRPVFYTFPDFRLLGSTVAAHGNRWLMPAAIMAPLFIFCFGWFIELPYNQMLGTVLAKGPMVRAVALTFDDGPGESTAQILDILKSLGVKATFFVIGKNAAERPDLLRRMLDEGHEIGNHSYSHSLMLAIDRPLSIKKDIDSTAAVIRQLTGIQPTDFRPPHGWRTPWTLRTCHHLGYETVLWTIDTQDWLHTPAEHIRNTIVKKAKPGAIILLHDRLNTGEDHPMSNTIEALPTIIDELTRMGYSFVTIEEMKPLRTLDDLAPQISFHGVPSPVAAAHSPARTSSGTLPVARPGSSSALQLPTTAVQ